MNNPTRITAGLGAVAAFILIPGCGGDGNRTAGIDGTGATPPPPSPTPAVAVGTVTAFGSVFVNGIRFETDAADFTIDGESGTQSDLGIGDVVIVTGTIDGDDTTTGSATSVTFDDAVEGPVQAVDAAAGTLVVLGRTVLVTPATSFDDSIQPPSIDGLMPDQVVEVSGLIRSDGTIEATRIEPKPASLEWETTGLVSGHDGGALTFIIDALTVDYGTAALSDFPGGVIADGDLVEVKGQTTLGPGGELIATRVEFRGDRLGAAAGDRVEIEGFITRFATASDFDVAGTPVTTDAQTQFEGGSAADLGLDIKVEVEGTISADGTLAATKVDIRRARAVRLFAAVDSTSPASGGVPGTGSFVALGITIEVDGLTRREDKRDDVSPFGVSELAVGDFVEVRGTEFPAGSGQLLAGRLERDDADDTELQGFVTDVNEPDLTVLGVTIMTDAGTVFRDANDLTISASQFFADVIAASGNDAGSLVKATGREVAPQMIAADEVEFEFEL